MEVESLVKKCGKPKMVDAIKLPPPELYSHVEVCYQFPSFIDCLVVFLLHCFHVCINSLW